VTADVTYAEFEADAKKHPKIATKLSKNQDIVYFLRENFDARVVIMADRVQFSAPAKHIEEVKPIIKTLIQQLAEDLTYVEVEIKDAKKVQFIKLHEVSILSKCDEHEVDCRYFDGTQQQA
jgi:hypothetical protein